jgi:hypothetical protein
VDNKSGVGKEVRERSDRTSTPTQNGRRWLTFGELSGLFALFGALGYVVGILVLWVPISRNYTHDVAASWYSVSIVPKTIVIGHGFIRLLAPTLIYAALIAIALSPDYFPRLSVHWRRTVLQIAALSMAYLFSVGYVAALDFLGNDQFAVWEWTIVVLAPLPILKALTWATSFLRSPFQNDDERRGNVIKAITIVLLSSSAMSFCVFVLIAHRPPLPRVELTGSHSVEGRLLTHAEGYWYIIEPDGHVVAIPDDEAKTTEIFPMAFR